MPSRTPIQPVRIGASAAASEVAARLEVDGFYVPAIRPPTVAKDQARMRVTLSARHEEADVEQLLNALARAVAAVRRKEKAID